MAYSFNDLIRPMTRTEVQEGIYSALATAGVNTTAWKPGAVVRTMLVAVSATIAALTVITASIARSGFLEFAAGDWLTAVAKYVYGVERDLATFATGYVTLTNTAGGLYELEPGDLIVTNTVTGRTYRNQEAFTLEPLQTDLPPIAVIADERGTASDATPGQVTAFGTPLAGVNCTNTSAITGRDDESDTDLRTRCNERLGALSPMGPWDAYSYAIKTAKRDDGTGATLGVKRVRLTKDGYGNVNIYIASAEGTIAAPDVAIAQEACERWAEPQCVTSTVFGATPKTINIQHETWAYNTSGKTAAQVEDEIYRALRSFMQTQPIGGNVIDPGASGKVYATAIKSVIGATLPGLVIRTELTSPPGDVECLVSEVPILGTVTTTLHLVSTPEGYSVSA